MTARSESVVAARMSLAFSAWSLLCALATALTDDSGSSAPTTRLCGRPQLGPPSTSSSVSPATANWPKYDAQCGSTDAGSARHARFISAINVALAPDRRLRSTDPDADPSPIFEELSSIKRANPCLWLCLIQTFSISVYSDTVLFQPDNRTARWFKDRQPRHSEI